MISCIHYLNTNHECNLKCKRITKSNSKKLTYKIVKDKERQICERRFVDLAMLNKPLNDRQKIQWINNGIKYFHRFSINVKALSDVSIESCEEYVNLMIVEYNQTSFVLPKF